MVAFFGQHQHRRLTLASAQLDLLDGFCGREQLELRAQLGAAHARMRELEGALAELRERAGTRDRDLDLLAFEIEEIEELDPGEEEKASLVAERSRLRQLDGLLAAAGAGAEAITPSGDEAGVATLLAGTENLAQTVAGADAELDALAERLSALRLEAEDLGAELRRYADSLEAEPGRLDVVEDASSCTTGSSASTAAAWPRCSRTRSAAVLSGRASSARRSRPSAPRLRL